MDLSTLKDWLDEQGFSFGKQVGRSQMNECEWYAWRRTKLEARECETNDSKIQLVIWPYQYKYDGNTHESVEVEVTGEAGEVWYQLKAYSMKPADLSERLDSVETALIGAWNALSA